jgi:hypothetical protein
MSPFAFLCSVVYLVYSDVSEELTSVISKVTGSGGRSSGRKEAIMSVMKEGLPATAT